MTDELVNVVFSPCPCILLCPSCGIEHVRNVPAPHTHRRLSHTFPQPELKELDLIDLLDWEGVGLQLGVGHHKLQTIKLDCPTHASQKREMFRVWMDSQKNQSMMM